MTPKSTERRPQHMHKPSGGELDLTSSPTNASVLGPDPQPSNLNSTPNPPRQAFGGQNESASFQGSHSRIASANLAVAKPAEESSGTAQDDSQNMHLRKDFGNEGLKQYGPEAPASGPFTFAKDVMDLSILPYPKRPSHSSVKATVMRAERPRIREPRRLNDKKQMHSQNSLSKVQQHALADYIPWDGKHTEDQLSESLIRGGYQVKQHVLNEANTGRPTLAPHLKNNAGLSNLSTFFSSLLQKRHDSGKVVAASTFKPPPRVTLTDTKREVWLGELASSAVPLRKLSRTIPHGIRGRVLLEQCMAKHVPMARALWLAKCVGANELRAFRRKGISGQIMLENEQKWIKDWTLVLQAFIEDASRISGQPEWKSKMSYALQLTSRFFADGLLDKDQFLDWALTKLEFAVLERLPFALLVVQIVHSGISQSLKHGCWLASICLSKLNELSKSPDKDLYAPVLNRLYRLVTTLALEHPNCFLVRRIWANCRETFVSIILEFEAASSEAVNESERVSQQNAIRALRQVKETNDHIARVTSRSISQEEPRVLSLVKKLDSFPPQMSIERVASECLAIISDKEQLISILIQWATSLYREGLYRIFIVFRLIRLWRDEGNDTDRYILRSLETLRHSSGVNPRKLSRMVAELIRAGYFDTAWFLRSLISTGHLNDKHRSCDLQILIDMPVSHLQPSVLSLRNMLVRSSAANRPFVPNLTLSVESFFNMEPNVENESPDLNLDSPTITWSEAFRIGESISRGLLNLSPTQRKMSPNLNRNATTNFGFTVPQLSRFAAVLGAVGDVFAVAEFLSTVTPTADADGLVTLLETLERHFRDLAAAGTMESLFKAATERYRTLRTTTPPVKRLVLLMSSVGTRLAENSSMLSYLKQELASCDSNVGIAANTPMSDLQLEATNETEIELERILAGGTVMDLQRLSQTFDAIVSRIVKVSNFDQTYSTLTNLIGTLKVHNEERFKEVLTTWLRTQLSTVQDDTDFGSVVLLLLNAGCVDLSTFATMAENVCNELASEDTDTGACASAKVLLLFFPVQQKADGPYDIRHGVDKLSRICDVNPGCVLQLLVRVLKSGDKVASWMQVDTITQSKRLLDGLRSLIVQDFMGFGSVLESASSLDTPASLHRFKCLIAGLVDPSGELGFFDSSAAEKMRFMFETVDGFSMPFYQICLKTFNADATESQSGETSLSDSCLDALVDCEVRKCPMWATLISAMGVNMAQHIRKSAEQLVFVDPSTSVDSPTPSRELRGSNVRFWTTVVEATSFSLPEHGEPETGRSIEKYLSLAMSLTTDSLGCREIGFQHWIQSLCDLALIHSRSCVGVIKSKVVHALCNLLARNVGQLTVETLGSVFEATRYFVDDLPAHTFALIRSNLGPLKTDRQIRFLFGIHENADGWLYIARSPSAQQTPPVEPTAASPFPLRRWELLPESAANIGANDTALSLRLFDATKIK